MYVVVQVFKTVSVGPSHLIHCSVLQISSVDALV